VVFERILPLGRRGVNRNLDIYGTGETATVGHNPGRFAIVAVIFFSTIKFVRD